MGLLLDLFENLRKTKSDVKSNKQQQRRYDFDAGFTGDRKSDYELINSKKVSLQKNKKEKYDDEKDER